MGMVFYFWETENRWAWKHLLCLVAEKMWDWKIEIFSLVQFIKYLKEFDFYGFEFNINYLCFRLEIPRHPVLLHSVLVQIQTRYISY